MLRYDEVLDNRFGVVHGSGKLIYIKTGVGGTIYGYKNKYLNISQKLHSRYGYTVVVADGQYEWFHLKLDLPGMIDAFSADDVCYVGISKGASLGAQECWEIEEVSSAILFNAPLMINWPAIKRGASRFHGKDMLFVYGENDPSYKYVELINTIDNDVCRYKTVKGEDHNFSQSVLLDEIDAFIYCLKYRE